MGIGISLSFSFDLCRSVPDAPPSTSETAPCHLSRPWVLLPSVPAAAAVSGLLAEDPTTTGPRRILVLDPYIAAADPSGILLLCTAPQSDRPRYFVWDAATYTASELPRLDPHYQIRHPCGVGLIRRDDGGQVLVADLQFAGSSNASLLCYTAESRRWGVKLLRISQNVTSWFSHSVISYAGRLWWVDLSHGILSCDPFAEEPDLFYTDLPQGCKISMGSPNTGLSLVKHRCLKVSGGKVRYIHVDQVRHKVSVWTLAADEGVGHQWLLNYTSPLDWLLADPCFKRCAPLLQEKVPMLALLHPFNPNIAYFWHDSRIFAADLRSEKLLEHHYLAMGPTSCSIHAWEVSASLQQRLEDAGDVFTAMSGITLFTKPRDEQLQVQMVFDPYLVTEITSRADLGSIVRVAVSCKLLRRYILHPTYVLSLNQSPKFASSLFLGHFVSFRDNVHTRLHFVSATHYNHSRLLAELGDYMNDQHLIDTLDDFSPLGSHGGFMVLREHMDPRLRVWNPLTKVCVLLPEVNGITYRSSCILQVNGTSFLLVLCKLRLNHSELQIQTFTSKNTLSLSSSRNVPVAGMWTDVSVRPVPGPAAKIVKPRAFPVVLNQAAYWMCKCASKYVILKVRFDTQEDPTFLPVPVECSSTAEFHRNNILLVPASTGGRIGSVDATDGLLGLVAVDSDCFGIWMMSDAGQWTRRAVIPRGRIMESLDILPVQLELVWCARASGFMLVNISGFGSAIVNLNTLEAAIVLKTAEEKEQPFIRIRSSCPYEFDLVNCLSSMRTF